MKRKATFNPRSPCWFFHSWVWYGTKRHYRSCKHCGVRQHMTVDENVPIDWDWMLTGQWDPTHPDYIDNALTRSK